VLKVPEDFGVILNDLKLCGRREFQNLLRIHHKYQNIVRNEKNAQEK
jgi:hypothetical protein